MESLIHFAPEKGHVSEIITFSSSWEHSLVLKTDTELRRKKKKKEENQSLLRCSEVLVSASAVLCTKEPVDSE